jgi:hypothetical protein
MTGSPNIAHQVQAPLRPHRLIFKSNGLNKTKPRRSRGILLKALTLCFVVVSNKTRFPSSSSVLVEDTLGNSPVDGFDCNCERLGFILSSGCYRIVGLLDRSPQSGFIGFVAQSFYRCDLYALFGGFDIGHDDTSFSSHKPVQNIVTLRGSKINTFFQNLFSFILISGISGLFLANYIKADDRTHMRGAMLCR